MSLAMIAPTLLLSWSVSSGIGKNWVPSSAAKTRIQSVLPGSASAFPRSTRCGDHMIVSMATENLLKMPFDALSIGLTAVAEQNPKAPGGAEDEELAGHKSRLLSELGDVEAAGLVFEADGAPSPSTLGVALVLTAQHAAELDFPSIADLVTASESTMHQAHASRAQLALATVVSETLAEMEAAEQFTDASVSAAISVNAPQAQTMEDARSMHMRWAILELARARFAEDRPADWGSVGK
jgi:hypothetical protein